MTRMQDLKESMNNLEKSIAFISTKVDKIDSLDTKLESRLTEINDSLMNIKNVVIENLLKENKRLDGKINFLENKLKTTESQLHALESYCRRNNLEFEGIPSDIKDEDLEKTVIGICGSIGVDITDNDIED